jgi:ATP-dependent Clp protease protease subunit
MVPVGGEPVPCEDVFGRLLERRVVMITGHLDQDVATRAAAQLMLLDATGDAPIDVHWSCPDGELDAALALADTIDLLGVTVRARARGQLGGPAVLPFASADRRLAHPHAVFVLRDRRLRLEGRADDVNAMIAAHQHQLDALHARLAAAAGQTPDRIAGDLRAGTVLGAEEALAYGLVHELITGRAES